VKAHIRRNKDLQAVRVSRNSLKPLTAEDLEQRRATSALGILDVNE